jgi:multicomponent Na+:H+ antiporter subunit D
VFLASALLDAAFFFPIVFRAFFKQPKEDVAPGFNEASLFMVTPLMATAGASLVLGLFPNAFVHFIEIAALAVRNITGG